MHETLVAAEQYKDRTAHQVNTIKPKNISRVFLSPSCDRNVPFKSGFASPMRNRQLSEHIVLNSPWHARCYAYEGVSMNLR
jgi:hypothetical protein